MKNFLPIRACVVLLFVSFAAFAADADTKQSTPAQSADKVLVTVDGTAITEAQLEAEIAPRLARIPPQMPPQFIEQYKKNLRKPTAEALITGILLEHQAEKLGIKVTEQEVTEHIEKIAAQQKPPLSIEDFKALVEAYGRSFDEVKDRIRKGLTYQKLLESQWKGKISVTEQEAEQYYQQNPKEFEKPEQVKASHILIRPDTSDPNHMAQAKAAAKAKAQQLLQQIRQGTDFAELARANSACPSASNGGDLGYQSRGVWVKPFEEAAFSLKTGQVSDIVETQFGYHIIKVTGRHKAGTISFKDAESDIMDKLKTTKQQAFAKQYIDSLKKSAKIVYLDETLKPDSNSPAAPGTGAQAGSAAPQ